jgi:Na+/H+ antiporter NhaD/arsenite permease-like protein
MGFSYRYKYFMCFLSEVNHKVFFIGYLCPMFPFIITIFVIGYLLIALEQKLNINKAASALLTGVLCWVIYIVNGDAHTVSDQLSEHLSDISEILFFLMGAMTIVELIDAHNGFDIITKTIVTLNKRKLLWILSFIAFFLSAILDNLTTAIVMVSLLRKLVDDRKDKLFFAGMIIIAANAGGAWSPIGDVTTTMLWIGERVSAPNIIIKLLLPSIICLVVPLLALSTYMKGDVIRPVSQGNAGRNSISSAERNTIFIMGLGSLIFVPVFKSITHLPPFMGILFGLGLLWVVTEFIHGKKDDEDHESLTVVTALRRIDVPSILFFLGILLAVSSLQSIGYLSQLAEMMNDKLRDTNVIVLVIGLLSAVVDNVPLVAAAMGMYDISVYPIDHYLWEFLAYCTGTGGSILIIGSAAGVAAMGIEKIDFMEYLKKISWLAALGYFAGAMTYILLN